MYKKDVTIDRMRALFCPICQCDNLHQVEATTFWMDLEDSETGTFTKTSKGVVKEVNDVQNPSERRDGMLIRFFCEHCSAEPELAIRQHKGVTYVEWNSVRIDCVE